MNDLQKGLLKKGRLQIVDEVNRDMYFYVREALAVKVTEGAPQIYVDISSNGGGVTPGLDIHDLLKFYPGRKIGIVNAMAASMASVILQACDYRVAMTHARILIHHVSNSNISLDVVRDPVRMAKFVSWMEADQLKLYQILVNRTSKSIDEVRKTCELDTAMTTQEALEYHLIDQIVITQADIKLPDEEKK